MPLTRPDLDVMRCVMDDVLCLLLVEFSGRHVQEKMVDSKLPVHLPVNPPRLNHRPFLTRQPKAVVFPLFRANLEQRINCRRALFSLSKTSTKVHMSHGLTLHSTFQLGLA
jgi:hypothetical protein